MRLAHRCVMFSKCWLKFSFWSSVTPRYLYSLTYGTCTSLIVSGGGVSRRIRGGEKMRAADLFGEMMSPHVLNHFVIWSRVDLMVEWAWVML